MTPARNSPLTATRAGEPPIGLCSCNPGFVFAEITPGVQHDRAHTDIQHSAIDPRSVMAQLQKIAAIALGHSGLAIVDDR